MESVPRGLTFGEHADAYERARPEWPEDATRWLVPEGAQLVVELGAGTGKLTRAIAALGVRVVAIEPDPRMLAVLRAGGLEGVEGSAEQIPIGDGEADAVVAGSCLHWFDLGRAMPEIHRVLCSGGRFGAAWNHRDSGHPTIALMNEAVSAIAPERTVWRDRDWAGEIAAGGLFRDIEHRRFAHLHALRRDALDDHLHSYATIASLPDDERSRVFEAVARVLDADPEVSSGETMRLPFVVDAYRATRT